MSTSAIPPPREAIPAGGLSAAEAARRLAEDGPNDPAPSRQRSTGISLLLFFLNPLAIVLLIAAVFSAFLGQAVDAVIIVLVVILGNAINFWQTYRSQRSIERLRKAVVSTASALRDGDWKEVPRHDVVIGDIVRVFAGDLVPADSKLLESRDLYVQEAALTGESFPVEKETALDEAADGSARGSAYGFSRHLGRRRIGRRHICEQVGIDTSGVVLGDEIERMTDSALQHVVGLLCTQPTSAFRWPGTNHDSNRCRRPSLPPQAAALGHFSHPQFHDLNWPDQLDLRFFDVLCAPAVLSCKPGRVSHWMVRRVSCNTDVRSLCYPDVRERSEEQTQWTTYSDCSGRCCGRATNTL